MAIRGRGRKWRRVVPAALAVTLASAASVWAQSGATTAQPTGAEQTKAGTPANAEGAAGLPPAQSPPQAAPGSQPDQLSPTRLLNGPSLHETGRIAVAPPPTPMSLI